MDSGAGSRERALDQQSDDDPEDHAADDLQLSAAAVLRPVVPGFIVEQHLSTAVAAEEGLRAQKKEPGAAGHQTPESSLEAVLGFGACR